ncbi:MAG: hypothetical protein H6974_11065 [Gammaproteobacteria bacterium]|nr:hypothetical protein [Gammaproteobacteria bacterium]
MIDITLRGDARQALAEMPGQLHSALEQVISRSAEEGAVFMKQELARQRLAATSQLINSVAAEAVGPLAWRFGPHVEYGFYLYQGRRPGGRMPPLQAIRDWVQTKRLGNARIAWAIARKISQRGAPARDFVTPTVAFTAQRLHTLAEQAVRDATGAA